MKILPHEYMYCTWDFPKCCPYVGVLSKPEQTRSCGTWTEACSGGQGPTTGIRTLGRAWQSSGKVSCKTVHELRTCLKLSTHGPHPDEPAHQTLRTQSTTRPWPHARGHVRQLRAVEDKGVKTAVGAYASIVSPGLKQGPDTRHIQNI